MSMSIGSWWKKSNLVFPYSSFSRQTSTEFERQKIVRLGIIINAFLNVLHVIVLASLFFQLSCNYLLIFYKLLIKQNNKAIYCLLTAMFKFYFFQIPTTKMLFWLQYIVLLACFIILLPRVMKNCCSLHYCDFASGPNQIWLNLLSW